jgi:pseudoazurin
MKKLLLITLLISNYHMYGANFEVKMLNQGQDGVMVFEPPLLKINAGDTVTFKATDAAHNSASIPGMIPNGASSWNGELSRDISVTFDVPGIYGYQCTPHAMMAMVGVIQVDNNTENLDAVKIAASTFKTTFVMNQSRLDDLLSEF